ncbi:TMhelix containing protein [Vibrio phage 1.187.O._10N.286.49.F1]|nr:TMhelix containing protein [Vibrio phage 1.187.O._10N.286.49.F1]
MLTILFYAYFTITAAVLSAMLVSLYQVVVHNKTTPSALASLKQENIDKWYEGRSLFLDKWNTLSNSQKYVAMFGIILGFLIWMVIYTFIWWVAPKTRLGILYNCLTNEFVLIK